MMLKMILKKFKITVFNDSRINTNSKIFIQRYLLSNVAG